MRLLRRAHLHEAQSILIVPQAIRGRHGRRRVSGAHGDVDTAAGGAGGSTGSRSQATVSARPSRRSICDSQPSRSRAFPMSAWILALSTGEISVLFSAFNALTLSPALAAMLLRPKKEARGPLGAFFRRFNRVFGKATDGYVGACQRLIRKAGLAFLMLGLMVVAAVFFGKRIPNSFLPDEDQGYLFAGLQLPEAASLQRSSEAAREVEKAIMETPGVAYVSSVMGYSMLSGVNATYSSFFFVSLKPWDERKTPETSYAGIKAHLQRALSRVPSGLAFSFPPPAIPGVGTSGGATFILEDRSGTGIEFLGKNTQIFLAEARKRPELMAP